MKKLLLTLGTTAVIATPLIAVVACEKFDDDIHVTYSKDTRSLFVTNIDIDDSNDDDDFEELATAIRDRVILDSESGEAHQIVLKGEFSNQKIDKTISIKDIKDDQGQIGSFDSLSILLVYKFAAQTGWTPDAILGKRIIETPTNPA